MSARKTKIDPAIQRDADRQSLAAMLANPTPMNNVAAVGADMTADPAPKAEVQPQVVVDEVVKQPELIAQTETRDEVALAPVAQQQAQVEVQAQAAQPQQVVEPAQVAQAQQPASAPPQPVQEPAQVTQPVNPMAALIAAALAMAPQNGKGHKEANVSCPLDPLRHQLLGLAKNITGKSHKEILIEGLDMWLKKHGYEAPPQ